MSIKLTDLTNELVSPPGTGVFDTLMQTAEARLQAQYDQDRITGSDFAQVYLGVMQEVLKSSISFLLNKDKAAGEVAVIEATLEKQWGYDVTRDVDGSLVLGASVGTGLIDEQITDAQNKVDLTIGQIAEIYAKVALVGQQQETELAQTSDPTGGLLLAKKLLVDAQTLGFASDTKQKVLKQMMDGYAVTLSIAGTATAPDATKEPQIDALTGEILADVGSSVNIP